jgi:uncharacterized oligopeptide transporter (OPT) family protein
LALIAKIAMQRFAQQKVVTSPPAEDWKKTNGKLLALWVACWGIGLVCVGSLILHVDFWFVLFAVGLVFVFLLVNGIADGISDQNPISAAFVTSVLLMAVLGLKDPGVGLMCASILLISCTVGVDMQQDRSTGWRLGTNRVIQFRYQVIGILVGAFFSVLLARLFMQAYPILQVNGYDHPDATTQWQSTMTFKFVGALEELAHPRRYIIKALFIGIGIGLVTEILRKLVWHSRRYLEFARGSRKGRVTDFMLDAFVIPSPYASSFGGFVNLWTIAWFTLGGMINLVFESINELRQARRPKNEGAEIPPDMSTMSLTGGGLIAGDSLAALFVGIYGLLHQLICGS